MQRGAAKRDREPADKESDYAGKAPILRPEDRGHLGLTDDAFDKLAGSLKEKVLGYARAGFRKPADVSRLLNKERYRTLGGTEWNPRLVYFLLSRIYGDRPRKPRNPPTVETRLPEPDGFDAPSCAVERKPPPEKSPKPARPGKPTKPAKTTKQPAKTAKPAKPIKVRPPSDPVPLSADEMARRLEALKAHLSK